MAQIAVERRRGIPWWGWLLMVLAIIAILWWIFAAWPAEQQAVSPAVAEQDEAARAAPITEVNGITGAADQQALAGRRVDLTNVQIEELSGPNAFFVRDGQQMLLVVLSPPGQPGARQQPGEPGAQQRPGQPGVAEPGTGDQWGQQPGAAAQRERQPGAQAGAQQEGTLTQYDIISGDQVNVSGVIQRFPGYQQALSQWNLNPAHQSILEMQQVYVEADRLQVAQRVQRPEGTQTGRQPGTTGAGEQPGAAPEQRQPAQ